MEHVTTQLEYYARLATEQAATTVATGALSSAVGASSLVDGASSSAAGLFTFVHDISSGTEMDIDFCDSLIRECDEEESEDDEF
jgi:hypothetical protein